MSMRGLPRAVSALSFLLLTASCSGSQAESVNFPLTIRKEIELATPSQAGGIDPSFKAALAVAWSPDGSKIAAASDYGGTLTVWDNRGRLLKRVSRRGGGPTLSGSIAFAHGSADLLFPPPAPYRSDVALGIWDTETGNIVGNIQGEPSDVPPNTDHFVVSEPANVIVSQNWNRISYFREDSRSFIGSISMKYFISSLNTFMGGKRILAGSQGQVFVLDAADPSTRNQYQAYAPSELGSLVVSAVAGSPQGDLIFAGVDEVAVRAPYASTQLQAWEKSIVPALILRTSDGSHVASFSSAAEPIRSAAWDPKGRYVAFVDNSGQLFLWQPRSASLSYLKIRLPGKSLSIAISPDGDHIAAATDVGVLVYSLEQRK